MTPAMERCLSAYRTLCNGRAPEIGELAEAQGIRKQSAENLIFRLRAVGYDVPLSRGEVRNDRGLVWKPIPRPVSDQQREQIRLVDLLRRADKLVSRYGDPDDAEWAAFRRDAKRYLVETTPAGS